MSTTVLVLLVILLILAILIVPFFRQLILDRQELATIGIEKKFEVMVGIINDGLMDGLGEVTLFDNDSRTMNLFSDHKPNMLVQFYYSIGHLQVFLKYKYFQQELVFKKLFAGVRQSSLFMQKDMGNEFVELARQQMRMHEQKVSFQGVSSMSGSPDVDSESNPLSLFSNMYESLSTNQKLSMANLLYGVAHENGVSDIELQHCPSFAQFLIHLNVKFSDCKENYNMYGCSRIADELSGLSGGLLDMFLMTGMEMIEMLNPSLVAQLRGCFYERVKLIGVDREYIENMLEKVMALSNLFKP